MRRYRSQSSARSVTPSPAERGPQRQSAARRALIMGLLEQQPEPDPELSPSPPPRLLHALPVVATPGGSINRKGNTSVPLEQTPGGRIRRIQRKPAVPLFCDAIERVEALDMSEEETEELMEEAPWHVRRWVKDLPGQGTCSQAPGPSSPAPGPSSSAPGMLSRSRVLVTPSATSDVTVATEVDVRPSTSGVTVLSSVPRCDYGSDLDSEHDEEFNLEAGPSRHNVVEDIEEPMQEFIAEVDMGMDNAADGLLGISPSFTWVSDFESFRGKREEFSGPTPGPLKDYDSPYDAFIDIWDKDIIQLIVLETNRYAQQTIEAKRSRGILRPSSRLRSWTDTNADEIMTFFAILMYMAIDPRTSIAEYWTTEEVLQLSGFRNLMSYNRYVLLSKCLHFVDNTAVASQQLPQSGDSDSVRLSAKLNKMAPIVKHLDKKFKSLYNLGPNLSIDESLTLFKGRLSWVQTIRSKAARFGIKSYELCESNTGYMAGFQIYTGKGDGSGGDSSLGVNLGGKSTKVVLELLQGLERRGHCVVMDNFYNCPSLARYLKSLGFDCFGTLRVCRRNVPSDNLFTYYRKCHGYIKRTL